MRFVLLVAQNLIILGKKMSHTGNATGNFEIEGLKGSRDLTPFIAAQNLKSVLHCWYNADFLQVDSNGLVSGATDLTGRGNHGIQSNAANRLTYFPSDALFMGKPSFGSSSFTGQKHILAGGSAPLGSQARIIISTRYQDGLVGTFADWSALVQSGTNLFIGRISTNGFWSGYNFFYSKNGFSFLASGTACLPMPASTLVFAPASAISAAIWHFGCDTITINRNWFGGYRNMIITNSSISAAQVALIEGVIAWDGGHQNSLVSTHPYRYCPPRIRD
jgi:hypothetical protein